MVWICAGRFCVQLEARTFLIEITTVAPPLLGGAGTRQETASSPVAFQYFSQSFSAVSMPAFAISSVANGHVLSAAIPVMNKPALIG